MEINKQANTCVTYYYEVASVFIKKYIYIFKFIFKIYTLIIRRIEVKNNCFSRIWSYLLYIYMY